jgi:hypothetical protein
MWRKLYSQRVIFILRVSSRCVSVIWTISKHQFQRNGCLIQTVVPRMILVLIVHIVFHLLWKLKIVHTRLLFYSYLKAVCLLEPRLWISQSITTRLVSSAFIHEVCLCTFIRDGKSEFIDYFVYNSLWQMQSLSLLEVITPFFQRILCSCLQAFWSCLRRQILVRQVLVVIESTYASRSNVMITGISSTQWLLVVAQTCDNPIELGTDYIGGVGKVQISAAWAFQRPFSWRRWTALDCTRLAFC